MKAKPIMVGIFFLSLFSLLPTAFAMTSFTNTIIVPTNTTYHSTTIFSEINVVSITNTNFTVAVYLNGTLIYNNTHYLNDSTHTITLSGLKNNTAYSYMVTTTDGSGTNSTNQYFTVTLTGTGGNISPFIEIAIIAMVCLTFLVILSRFGLDNEFQKIVIAFIVIGLIIAFLTYAVTYIFL